MGHGSGTIFGPNIDPRGDVATVLGRNTGDVALLCSDREYYDTGEVDGDGNPIYAKRDANAINFWSLRKPIRHYCDTILTDAQWKDANYGYTINSYDRLVGEANTGLLYAHINNQTWLYLKPRGADVSPIEWCRILDFDGYDASADNPFVVSYSPTPTLNDSARIDLTFLDQLLTWGRFSAFGPTYANLYLGLVAYPSGSSTPTSCYLLPVTSSRSGLTILDIAGNERFTYPVPSSVFSAGSSYKLRPIIMTYDAGDNYGNWISVNTQSAITGSFYDILCPEITITPSQQITPDQNVSIYVDAESAVYSGDFPMTITSVPFYITNNNAAQITDCVIYVYFKDYQYSAQGQDRELGHTSSFVVNANASNVQKTVSGNLTIMPATYLAQGRYEFSFRIGGTTYTKTGTFTIGEK